MQTTTEIKEAIVTDLKNQQNVSEVTLHKSFGNRRTDIYAKINGESVAIQLVYNHLSTAKLEQRTLHFNNYGLAVTWIFPYKFPERFYTRKSYNWCHTAFYGKVYCYNKNSEVIPVKFQAAKSHIPKRKWYEDGENKKGGGYLKRLKRIKNRVEGEPVSLTQDFHSRHRDSWENTPECLIFNKV